MRDIVDAVNDQTRTGCAWRYLPHDLPPWGAERVCGAEWRHSGLFDRVHDAFRNMVRVAAVRNEQRRAGHIDNLTAKSAGVVHEAGYETRALLPGREFTPTRETMAGRLREGVPVAGVRVTYARCPGMGVIR